MEKDFIQEKILFDKYNFINFKKITELYNKYIFNDNADNV